MKLQIEQISNRLCEDDVNVHEMVGNELNC